MDNPATDSGFRWPKFTKTSMPDVKQLSERLLSFKWGTEMKLPAGAQMPDGSIVPDGAVVQSDGAVKIPVMPDVQADRITLPNGIKLSAALNADGETPPAAAVMPDGSKPSASSDFAWGVSGGPSPPSALLAGIFAGALTPLATLSQASGITPRSSGASASGTAKSSTRFGAPSVSQTDLNGAASFNLHI